MIVLPILTTSLILTSPFKGWENVLFELGSGRFKQTRTTAVNMRSQEKMCLCFLVVPLSVNLPIIKFLKFRPFSPQLFCCHRLLPQKSDCGNFSLMSSS